MRTSGNKNLRMKLSALVKEIEKMIELNEKLFK